MLKLCQQCLLAQVFTLGQVVGLTQQLHRDGADEMQNEAQFKSLEAQSTWYIILCLSLTGILAVGKVEAALSQLARPGTGTSACRQTDMAENRLTQRYIALPMLYNASGPHCNRAKTLPLVFRPRVEIRPPSIEMTMRDKV